MSSYIQKRLLLGIPTIIGVLTVVFLLLRVAPGDVTGAILSGTPGATPEQVAKLRQDLGLDLPLWKQYAKYVGDVVRGDLGPSLLTGKSVAHEIALAARATAELAILAVSLSAVLGLALGVLTAIYRGSWFDFLTRGVTLGGLAIPTFWLATLALLLPAIWFNHLPPLAYVSPADNLLKNLQQFSVPALVLSLHLVPQITRLVRSSMLDTLSQPFVTVAHAKGLPGQIVVTRHVLRNSLIPAVSFLGVVFAHLIGGAVVTEVVFNLGGLGSLLVHSIETRDYQMAQGVFLFVGVAFVFVNLLVDLSYGWLDPRIRY